MSGIKETLLQDKFCCETVGIELLEMAPGRAKTRLKIGPQHLNGLGIVQGGVLFTLADFALAAAANAHGNAAVLINSSISYAKAVSEGTLLAEAEEEAINPKLATYRIRITDQDGELLAVVQSTVYRKKQQL